MFPVMPVVLTICSLLDFHFPVILCDMSAFFTFSCSLCSLVWCVCRFKLQSCMPVTALWIIQASILPGVAGFSNFSLPFRTVYVVLLGICSIVEL